MHVFDVSMQKNEFESTKNLKIISKKKKLTSLVKNAVKNPKNIPKYLTNNFSEIINFSAKIKAIPWVIKHAKVTKNRVAAEIGCRIVLLTFSVFDWTKLILASLDWADATIFTEKVDGFCWTNDDISSETQL